MNVLSLLGLLVDIYSVVVLAAVVLSWIGVSADHPIAGIVFKLTEPVLAPIRRVLPDLGGLDFSPMLLLIGLRFLRSLFLR